MFIILAAIFICITLTCVKLSGKFRKISWFAALFPLTIPMLVISVTSFVTLTSLFIVVNNFVYLFTGEYLIKPITALDKAEDFIKYWEEELGKGI